MSEDMRNILDKLDDIAKRVSELEKKSSVK